MQKNRIFSPALSSSARTPAPAPAAAIQQPVLSQTSSQSEASLSSSQSLFDALAIAPIRRGKKPKRTIPTLEQERSQRPRNEEAFASGPRVEIVDGQIVLKESSLLVSGQTLTAAEEADYEEVEEGAFAAGCGYSAFLKHRKPAGWSTEQTAEFYQVLRQCGTDFSLMQSFFPERSRKQLKSKFSREEKLFPELIKQSLLASIPLDVEKIQAEAERKGKELSVETD